MRTTSIVLALMAGMTAKSYASTSYSIPGGTVDAANNPVSASAILTLSQVGSQEVLTITGVSLASSSADLIDVRPKRL
jgi:hypothetical protein